MNKSLAAVTMLTALMCLTPAWSQETQNEDNECVSGAGTNLGEGACITSDDLLGALDLTVPENALFALLGTTPDTVIRPKVGDKFMISALPQIADALGNEQYAIGFEVNPGLLMMPRSFTLAELMGRAGNWTGSADRVAQLRRATRLSRFTISGAASRTTEGAETSRYGLGLNYNHDTGSPLIGTAQGAYGDCIREAYNVNLADVQARALATAATEIERESPGLPADELQRRVGERAAAILAENTAIAAENHVSNCSRRAAPWNRPVYGGGVAVYYSETSDAAPNGVPTGETQEETGFGAWATMARPLFGDGQITLSARYNDNLFRERQDGDNTITETVDGWRVGARYTHTLAEGASRGRERRSVRGFVEVAYSEEEFGDVDDSFTQAGIGLEVELQQNLFFQVVLGDTFGSSIERGDYLTGQLKWSFSRARAD